MDRTQHDPNPSPRFIGGYRYKGMGNCRVHRTIPAHSLYIQRKLTNTTFRYRGWANRKSHLFCFAGSYMDDRRFDGDPFYWYALDHNIDIIWLRLSFITS